MICWLGMFLAISSPLSADVVVHKFSTPYVSSNDSVDANLPLKISSADELNGVALNAPGAVNAFRYNDGTGGEMDYNPDGRISYFDNPGTYTVTFNNLGGIDIGEIRAYSVNGQNRSRQDYDVFYSPNGGVNYFSIINSVQHMLPGASNVSQIFDDSGIPLASGVTNLRFILRPVGTSVGGFDQHTSFVEIDAFVSSPVPEPHSMGLACLMLVGLIGCRYRIRRRQPGSCWTSTSDRVSHYTSTAISSSSTAGTPSV